MSKVDWITWKTDPKEIINPDKLEEEIDEYYQSYDSYMNSMIYDQIKNEMSKGGLSRDAINISGISPAYEISASIITTIEEIQNTMKNLKSTVKDIASQQKEIEKQQLIEAIEEKLEKEKLFLKNIESRSGMKDQIKNIGDDPEDIITIIQDRIKKLQDRLDIARSL